MNRCTPCSHQQRQQQISVWDKLQHYGGVFLDMTKPEQQYKAAQAVCNFLNSANAPSIEELTTSGLISAMLQCLIRTRCAVLQLQLLSALYVISSLTEDHRLLVRQAGPVPQLVAMLNSEESQVCEMVMRLLCRIIKDNPSECDAMCTIGGTAPLLAKMLSPSVKAALNVIQKLSLGSQYCVNVLFEHNIIFFIKSLLLQEGVDADIHVQALMLLCYMIQGGNQGQMRKILESNILPLLIGVLRSDSPDVRRVAAGTIYELLVETDPKLESSRENVLQILSILCDYVRLEELWVFNIIYDILMFFKGSAVELIYTFNDSDSLRKIQEMTTNSNQQVSLLAAHIVHFCHSNQIISF
uniref:Armadillo repeat-containing domain-containing protein n=1 Tax=Glossina pallidipes TaxID=7398 RepID=A0A1A9ZJL9_GLOPL